MSEVQRAQTMMRLTLRGSCAAAGLAIGLFASTGAWAESPVRAEAPTAVEPVAQAVETSVEPADAEAVVDAAADETAADETGATVADAAEEPAPDSSLIAEQLALMLPADGPAEFAALADFYASRGHAPAWVDASGLNDLGVDLVAALNDAGADGLHVDAYLNDPILSRMDIAEPATRAELDLLLSQAFLHISNDLMNGRFRQREATSAMRDYEPTMDMTQPMRYAVDTGAIAETLRGLAPPHEQYQLLRAALADYRDLAVAGGWEGVPDIGRSLEQGARNSAISALRARMTVSGDYVAPAGGVADDTYYDAALADAVKEFQRRHGLLDDAVVGPRTLSAINASIAYRIEQIAVAMERWRWYPRDLGNKFVMVNIPAFMVRAIDGDAEPLVMRVVVGTRDNQTAVFNDEMEYSQINPYWNVPQSIADNEYLPALRADPFYLLNQNIRIRSGGQEINPVLVDWSSIGGRFPYSLRQEPGSGNALGRIKFLFPNGHAIYMHDTPSRSLFNRTTRSFSHGCIRLQDPMAMAGFVFNGRYTVDEIEAMIASGRTRDLILDEHIPVYVAYFTAEVAEDGEVRFYNDLYDRDAVLISAMDDDAPEPPTVVADNTQADGLN